MIQDTSLHLRPVGKFAEGCNGYSRSTFVMHEIQWDIGMKYKVAAKTKSQCGKLSHRNYYWIVKFKKIRLKAKIVFLSGQVVHFGGDKIGYCFSLWKTNDKYYEVCTRDAHPAPRKKGLPRPSPRKASLAPPRRNWQNPGAQRGKADCRLHR